MIKKLNAINQITKKSTFILLTASAVVGLSVNSASAFSLTGSLTTYFHRFSGTIDPVNITLNGNTYNTGTITYNLDLTNPSKQSQTFDFDAMTQSYGADLLVTSPLLTTLGEPAQKIRVEFAGSISSINPTDFTPNQLTPTTIQSSTLRGGGTFGPGQLLTGWKYSNIQITFNRYDVRQNGDNNSIDIKNSTENNLDGTVDANLTAPDLSSTPLTGSGIGNSQSTPVPEPLTILGSIAALGFGGFLERKLGKNQKDEK